MPKNKPLSALNASKSLKTIIEIKKQNISLNELKLIAKIRGIKGYERMSEDKLLSALNKSKPVKTRREIRKENRDEDKICLIQKKIIMNLKKLLALLLTITIFNIKVWEIKTKIYQSKNILMLSNHIYVI